MYNYLNFPFFSVEGYKSESHSFDHPWFQTWIMFIGMGQFGHTFYLLRSLVSTLGWKLFIPLSFVLWCLLLLLMLFTDWEIWFALLKFLP